jgi:exosortase K
MKKSNHPFIAIVLIAFLFKLLQRHWKAVDLQWLLWPVKTAVEVFTGAKGMLTATATYDFPSLGCVIDASCAGVNFLLISWCALSSIIFMYGTSTKSWGFTLLITAIISYLLTLVANTARILGALTLLRLGSVFPWAKTIWMHQAEGILVYFSLLFTSCLALHYWIQKNTHNYEKLT